MNLSISFELIKFHSMNRQKSEIKTFFEALLKIILILDRESLGIVD